MALLAHSACRHVVALVLHSRRVKQPEATTNPLLFYEVHGTAGPLALLVHGFLSSRAQWLPNLPALSRFCRPVVVELFGHGRSPTPDDPSFYTPQHYVEEFERIRSALSCERWLLCGQSLGAALTLRYALDHPERVLAHAFTNSNSALAESDWGARVRPAMEAQARGLQAQGRDLLSQHPLSPARARRLPSSAKRALEADFALHTPQGIAYTGLHTVPDSSVRDRVSENTVQSLLVVGSREERFAAHRRFAEERMPQLEIVDLEAGHAVNLEAATAFNDAISRFFGRWVADEPG